MSSSNRFDSQRPKSSQRKSQQRDQINILLYKNSQMQGLTSRPKETVAPMSKTITLTRTKPKSSQGSYRDMEPAFSKGEGNLNNNNIASRKQSIENTGLNQKKISLSGWIDSGLRFEQSHSSNHQYYDRQHNSNNNSSQVQLQHAGGLSISGPGVNTLGKKRQKVGKSNFEYLYVIGRGGFGKVWKVQEKRTRRIFAMKEMSKAVILTKKSVPSVINEKTLLTQLKHAFLVNMFYAFQDRQTLYLVMDLMPGGDLRYHICKRKRFNQDQTRFFVACIFSGLEYLHNQNIIHRDIKPENLVLDNKGYIRITDLGIAKEQRAQNSCDTSGTPGYMAPEVMCRQNHSFAVDYYALGVICYELMVGKRPYIGRSRKQIRDQILSRQAIIRKQDIPQGWSIEAADFTNKLIQRKPLMRLGWGGADQIKKHPWLKNFPWDKLYRRELQSPFVPDQKQDNFDGRHHVTVEDEEMAMMIKQNGMLLRKTTVQQLFDGYTYEDELKLSEMNTTSSQLCKKNR